MDVLLVAKKVGQTDSYLALCLERWMVDLLVATMVYLMVQLRVLCLGPYLASELAQHLGMLRVDQMGPHLAPRLVPPMASALAQQREQNLVW